MSKVIKISLTEASINKAISELKTYEKWVQDKVLELIDKLVATGEDYAINEVGHVDTGETLASIKGYRRGNRGVIVAGGNAIWLEFGTGVTYNGAVGDSPHPKGKELGMTIGTYGAGHGADPQGWWYQKDGNSRWVHTYGIEANLFMYRTAQELKRLAPKLAMEVFGND